MPDAEYEILASNPTSGIVKDLRSEDKGKDLSLEDKDKDCGPRTRTCKWVLEDPQAVKYIAKVTVTYSLRHGLHTFTLPLLQCLSRLSHGMVKTSISFRDE